MFGYNMYFIDLILSVVLIDRLDIWILVHIITIHYMSICNDTTSRNLNLRSKIIVVEVTKVKSKSKSLSMKFLIILEGL